MAIQNMIIYLFGFLLVLVFLCCMTFMIYYSKLFLYTKKKYPKLIQTNSIFFFVFVHGYGEDTFFWREIFKPTYPNDKVYLHLTNIVKYSILLLFGLAILAVLLLICLIIFDFNTLLKIES